MEVGKVIGQMLYGIICFATLLSFVGTVLGGIWADQSWGRFWGWDPKENGAVLIVLWNALILHARWAGLIKDRGMAVLAHRRQHDHRLVWFGTNQLGVGLHAYGFNNTLAFGCMVTWVLHLFPIAAGLLPWGLLWKAPAPAIKSPMPGRSAASASRSPLAPRGQGWVRGHRSCRSGRVFEARQFCFLPSPLGGEGLGVRGQPPAARKVSCRVGRVFEAHGLVGAGIPAAGVAAFLVGRAESSRPDGFAFSPRPLGERGWG